MGALSYWRITRTVGLLIVWFHVCLKGTHANVQSKVRCSEQSMEVDIARTTPEAQIYLQQLKNYPDEACKPTLENGIATFKLSLLEKDISRCGMMKITNKLTGQKVYYHRVVIEEPEDSSRHTVMVKCSITELSLRPKLARELPSNHTAAKRAAHSEEYEADANTQIVDTIIGQTSEPTLLFNVRQGNKIIKDELVVSPGTPLQMEIYLNEESAKVYGLLVTYMQVTDTKSQEETIIYNGCSLDPYLFENFNTVDGDFLSAKFRAFKFPESSYVQFRGTVTVCVGKCRGIECRNGQIGFGRKRRSVEQPASKNAVFEMAMSMFIRVDFDPKSDIDGDFSKFIRKGKKRELERTVRAEEVQEQFKYITGTMDSTATAISAFGFSLLAILMSLHTML